MGLFNFFKKTQLTTEPKKKHKKFKGFWNDDNGLAITDGVSTVMTGFIIVFTVWVTREILLRPMSIGQLSSLEFVIEKVMYLMSIILVGHYGNGVIKTGVSAVTDTFANAKKASGQSNNSLPDEQDSNNDGDNSIG